MEQILIRIAVAIERVASALEQNFKDFEDTEAFSFNLVPSEMPSETAVAPPKAEKKAAKKAPAPAPATATATAEAPVEPSVPDVPPVVQEEPSQIENVPLDADTVVNAALSYYARDNHGLIDLMQSVGWEKAKGKATDYIRNNPDCWERVYKGSVA